MEWGNRIYIRDDFELEEEFKKISAENFHSETEKTSFITPSKEEVAGQINKWVSEVTHGRIEEILEPGKKKEQLTKYSFALKQYYSII